MTRRTIFGWMVAGLVVSGCGNDATNNADEATNNGTDPGDQLAEACDAQPGPGDACAGSQDCPATDCQCADGSVISTRSCSNGACQGRDACDDTCADSGSSNACVEKDTTNNTSSNNTSNNGTTSPGNNMTTGPMCENDLSMFADWAWTYDVACLEENCCEKAAYCATFASCRAYDDCLLPCFSGGTADQDCIQTCKDQNTTPEFLMDAYAPFSSCALNNGC